MTDAERLLGKARNLLSWALLVTEDHEGSHATLVQVRDEIDAHLSSIENKRLAQQIHDHNLQHLHDDDALENVVERQQETIRRLEKALATPHVNPDPYKIMGG